MAGSGGTTDTYTGNGRAFLAQMVALKSKPFVKIGVLQEEFDKAKDEKKNGVLSTDSIVTLGIVAVANEFGTDAANGYSDQVFADRRSGGGSGVGAGQHTPERSFIRSTADAKKNGEWRIAAEGYRVEIVNGRMTTDRALGLMGARIKKDVQEKIRSQVPPPNAPSTIAAKGSDHPLINTGQLLNSIDFEVHREGDR